MLHRKNNYSISNIGNVDFSVNKVVTEGVPVKKVTVIKETCVLNSLQELSKMPRYNAHQLEESISAGIPLERVPSTVLNPDRIDGYKIDILNVQEFKKEVSEEVELKK